MDGFFDLPPQVQQEILDGPALTPPNGTVPNLVDPPNQTTMAIIVAVICLFLGTTVSILRAFSRIFVSKKLYLEDYLGFLAFGPYGGMAWTYFEFLHFCGFFVHQWNVKLDNLFRVGYAMMILPITYSIVMLLTKTAILLEWTRIFVPKGTRNTFYWTSRILIALNGGMYLAAIIATALGCIPQNKFWYTWIEGRCIDRKALDICTATTNLVTDLFILGLPQKVIWTLNMTRPRKIGVSFVFSAGILACVCAAGRVYSTVTLDYLGDATYEVSKTFIWALAELTCVLVVFCLPAIPKAFSGPKLALVGPFVASLRSWTRWRSFGGTHKASKDEQSAWAGLQVLDRNDSLEEAKLVGGGIGPTTVVARGPCLDHAQHGSSGIFKTTETHVVQQCVPGSSIGYQLDPYYQGSHVAAWTDRNTSYH